MPIIDRDCKEEILNIINTRGYELHKVSQRLRDDKEVVIAAIKQDYILSNVFLMYASDRLKNDPEVVSEAVTKYGFAIQYASNRLRDDTDMVIKAINQTGGAIAYASNRLKRDREVVLKSLETSTLSLVHISEEFKDDYFIAMKALKLNGSALVHLSERLKDNKEIVIHSVSKVGMTFRYASRRLQMDREIILTSLINVYSGDSHSYITDERKKELEEDPAFLLVCYYKRILPVNENKMNIIHTYIKNYLDNFHYKKVLQSFLNRHLFIEEDKKQKSLKGEELPKYNIQNKRSLINSIPSELSIKVKEFIVNENEITEHFYMDHLGKTPFTPEFMFKMKRTFV